MQFFSYATISHVLLFHMFSFSLFFLMICLFAHVNFVMKCMWFFHKAIVISTQAPWPRMTNEPSLLFSWTLAFLKVQISLQDSILMSTIEYCTPLWVVCKHYGSAFPQKYNKTIRLLSVRVMFLSSIPVHTFCHLALFWNNYQLPIFTRLCSIVQSSSLTFVSSVKHFWGKIQYRYLLMLFMLLKGNHIPQQYV